MDKSFNWTYILGISFVAALGGLLFGYDWVVIGGAKPFYERFFGISEDPAMQGWAMSSALIGCISGAVASGWFMDRLGRKKSLILAAALFTVSAIGTGMANSFNIFIVYRLIGGLGIGLASAISPIYIAEVSPASLRGRFVSLNQLTIVVGILAAQIVNFLIADEIPDGATDEFIMNSWNGQTGWRWMFWAEAVPASMFFLLAFVVPESPRWLTKVGRKNESEKILVKIGGADYAKQAENEIAETLSDASNKVDIRALGAKKFRPILTIGIVLAIFQQWCGINVVFNYAEEIFTAAGFSVGDMLFNIVITGVVNLVFTFIAIRTVDSWGRRKLMLWGSGGLTAIYILLGGSYYFQLEGFVVLLFVVTAIAIYAMSLAPITWVVLSEIFPNKIRGAAMAVATTALWVACFLLTYLFPIVNNALNAYGSFWLFALITFSGYLFIRTRLPETKGKSLEQIEKELTPKEEPVNNKCVESL